MFSTNENPLTKPTPTNIKPTISITAHGWFDNYSSKNTNCAFSTSI